MKLIIIKLRKLCGNKVIICPYCEERILLKIKEKERRLDETKKMS